MVSYDYAFKICENCFKDSDLVGIGEVSEGEDFWIFRPKLESIVYGAYSIIVYKDDINKARLLWPPDELELRDKIGNAKEIFRI